MDAEKLEQVREAADSGQPVRVSVQDILLDPHNPRLRREERGEDQVTLLGVLLQRFKLEEIAESILDSGFLEFDPIVCHFVDDELIVLEGNRRIAAAKLLLDPGLAPPRRKAKWEDHAERLSGDYADQLRSIPVHVYLDRQRPEVLSYIGNRHVSGVMEWKPFEKASYIATLIEDHDWSYQDVAERLGSYPKHVERHYLAYRLIEQGRQLGLPGSDYAESQFGVLVRALQNTNIQEFLGLSYTGDPDEALSPIPEDRQDQLDAFLRWTFGTDETPKVLPDSRRLTDWGQILTDPTAVAYLERHENPDFKRAWIKAGGEAESVYDSLMSAAEGLESVVALVARHRGDEQIVDAAEQCSFFLAQIMNTLDGERQEEKE